MVQRLTLSRLLQVSVITSCYGGPQHQSICLKAANASVSYYAGVTIRRCSPITIVDPGVNAPRHGENTRPTRGTDPGSKVTAASSIDRADSQVDADGSRSLSGAIW